MKIRIVIWIIAIILALGIFFKWYTTIPPMLIAGTEKIQNEKIMTQISEKYLSYRSQELLVYWSGGSPSVNKWIIKFSDGIWMLRSIDPTGIVSFSGPNEIIWTIKGRGTVFLDFKNNILLSVDALVLGANNSKLLPSFYIQNGKKMFYDLGSIESVVNKELWETYKGNAIRDEKAIYSGFSDEEIVKNINILLEREPKKENSWNTYFRKDVRLRTILEDILRYMDTVKKQKKCGESAGSCVRFISTNIDEGKKIDPDIFLWLEDPLIMWAKKNSNLEVDFSWEAIFQKYHTSVLLRDPLAVNTRDSAIVGMIQSSQNPTYEMWLYLTYILSKEKKWSPYSLKIMTEMIRLGELLKNDIEHKDAIIEESNKALSNLRKVLEESYFDKKDDYLFVLKQNLKDEKWQKIDTIIFVNDLNQLISEIDKSTLFLEYPDFRVLRRHLSWFTCIFQKNAEYLQDIRICRGEL